LEQKISKSQKRILKSSFHISLLRLTGAKQFHWLSREIGGVEEMIIFVETIRYA
jgi:hypothetical protein